MNFDFSDDQKHLAGEARRFLDANCPTSAVRKVLDDEAKAFDEKLWKSVAEQGFPGFEVTAWNAIYAPRGTPKEIVQRLNAEVAKVLAQPETRQRLMQLGFEPAGGSPEALAAYEKQERAKWGPLIKAAGLKGD